MQDDSINAACSLCSRRNSCQLIISSPTVRLLCCDKLKDVEATVTAIRNREKRSDEEVGDDIKALLQLYKTRHSALKPLIFSKYADLVISCIN